MTMTPTEARGRRRFWGGRGPAEHRWIDLDRGAITHRYDRLAKLIPLFDWLFFQPPGFRRNAIERLALAHGDRVLEIGCGTGRNLPLLRKAVGAAGSVYGVDISAGMLAK